MIDRLFLPGVLGALSVCSPALGPPAAGAQPGCVEEVVLHVSSRTGDDDEGDGSADSAWRSITRALASDALRDGANVLLQIDLGQYDATSGESFPLRFPPGIRVRGLTSELTRIVATGEEVGVIVEGTANLGDLSVLGSKTAIRIPASADVHLQDVMLKEVALGIDRARPAPESRVGTLHLDSCRFVGLPVGLRVEGGGAVALEECAFQGGSTGIEWLDLVGGPDPDVPAPAPAAPPIPVHAALSLRRVAFDGCTENGLWRHGVSPNAPPCRDRFRIEDSEFRRCKVGIRADAPAGSSPLDLIGCRFVENTIFGIRSVGGEPLEGATTQVVDSSFRWNGVGLQLLTPRIPHRLERVALIDNLGAGLSLGCFGDRPATVRLVSALVADNGASGVLSLSDGHHVVLELDHCTVVANHGAGLENASRRGGTASWALEHCIVADNDRAEVLGLEPGDFTRCWLGRRPEAESWASTDWIGDPRFVDPGRRDWALREDSPARNQAEHAERVEDEGGGLARGPDLGAIQPRRR